jgi:hypothetical protein
MEWEFSPDQVVRGEVGYDLAEFRRDLANEIAANLGALTPEQFQRTYGSIYDLCYALATGRDGGDVIRSLAFDPPLAEMLESLVEPMRTNADMLGAILQRSIAGHVAHGMSLEQALALAASEHRQIASDPLPRTSPEPSLPF